MQDTGRAPTKVLFVASWGRSGTTVVDNVLNGYSGVFSAGELHYLWERGLIHEWNCGCGRPVPTCSLWGRILDAAYGVDRPQPRAVYALQREVIRVRRTPRLWRGRLPAAAEEYAAILAPLYRAIADVTGSRLIVDSSKLPPAAALLPHVPGIEPWLLHMVRDPRAVAHSWQRPTPKVDGSSRLMMRHSPRLSTMRWLGWNALIEATAVGYSGRRLRMRYEDFAADPRGEVYRLLERVGVPAQGDPFIDARTVRLPANHTVSGNPSRFRVGAIPIRPDDAWRAHLPRQTRRAVTALSLPLLPRYRYRLR